VLGIRRLEGLTTTKQQIQTLVDPARNPVRDQTFVAQLTFLQIDLKPRQARDRLKTDTNGGRIYKAAFVQKEITKKNLKERTEYGEHWQPYTVGDHWSRIFFTDEAHIGPSAQPVPTIMREIGKRYDPENVVERPKLKGSKFHIAAWINWWGKSEKLIFYNDEEDYKEQPPMPPKPRHKPRNGNEEEYQERLKKWEALKPHKVDVTIEGNHIVEG
jgi:hypothetical protein